MTTAPNTTASGAADFPEFPAHPEPQIMRWSALEIVAIREYGAAMFRAGRLAACAPVAPAPITEAEQAAWHAGLDEGRSQARAPLQQGEYLPLPTRPEPDGFITIKIIGRDVEVNAYRDSTLEAFAHAAIDADRAARGAAQAAPAPVAEDADPLQGAANWLVTSHTITSATALGGRLCIGYNRAERLFNAARAQAAQPEGGNHG